MTYQHPMTHLPKRLAVVAMAGTVLAGVPPVLAQIPAFPGADGAAVFVSGGRGGIVYHVTKLNSAIDDPQRNDVGTIRYGLNNSNFPPGVARTIVFDVGGVFHLGRLPQPANNWDPNGNGWDAQSRLTIGGTNVTLAGQTAPGGGVIFVGGGLKPQGNNNIIRNITVASGYGLTGWWKPDDPMPGAPGTAGASSDPAQWFPDNVVYDAMDISGTNIMIDHVSTIYATDETISMNEVAKNITVQYSNISQSQNYPQWDAEGGGLTGHAMGSLLEAGNTTKANISFHHNLYAHHKSRVPQSGAGQAGGYYDFRNNVFYNWLGSAGSRGGTTFWNLVNNLYLSGNGGDNPVGGTNPNVTNSGGGTSVIGTHANIYRTGNLLDSNKDGDGNDGVALAAGGAANPLWADGLVTYSGVTDTATAAFDRVLNYVGANWWTRDGVIDTPDERIIHQARTGSGKILAWADNPWNSDPAEGAEWRALKNTPPTNRAANWDTESSVGYGVGDGMPTWWELDLGLDPNVRDDTGDFDNDGYTNLEEYLNEIAAWPAPRPIVFTPNNGNTRYALINNWDIKWQPGKYDTARITNGATARVDAIGQHAGVLLVGEGGAGVLALDSGWVRVHQLLRVRETGVVQFNGGAIDLAAGAAIFDYSTTSPLHALTDHLATGRANGAWDGPGIHSSAAAAMPGTSLGIVEASDLGISSFEGQSVDGTTVLMRWTFTGDTDLDGVVDVADLGRLASNWQSTGTWFDGDFDYSGTIDVNDLGMLASNWQAGVATAASMRLSDALWSLGLPGMSVPEPAIAGVLLMPWSMRRPRRASVTGRTNS
jgi:pectate lyase